jgi:hypothetical protein
VARSGTTLVEQILASHPDVYGAGEMPHLSSLVQTASRELSSPFPFGFDAISREHLRVMGDQYVSILEDLVANPESEIRAVLSYCGLEFDPACLSFHETGRSVKTSSRAQVRRPIYSASVGRWKNYEKHLEPLIRTLDDG